MSITINGTTNTLTAASGLTIAGNTAVTGTLSATSTLTASLNATNSVVFGNVTDNNGIFLRIYGSSTSYNWVLANNYFAAGRLDFVPSTATGGTTFNTPVVSMSTTGLAVTGTIEGSVGLLVVRAGSDTIAAGPYIGVGPSSGAGRGLWQLPAGGEGMDGWMYSAGDGWVKSLSIRTYSLAPSGLLDLSATAAGQIKFPATQNASSNANTLDDYEEGTWTPTIGSGGGTITTSSANGSYVKIGRMVHATVNITITNAGTGTGALTFTVPFTSNTAGNSTAGSGVETAAVGFTGTCYLGTNSVTVSAYKDGFTTPIGTGNGLIYSIVYQTA